MTSGPVSFAMSAEVEPTVGIYSSATIWSSRSGSIRAPWGIHSSTHLVACVGSVGGFWAEFPSVLQYVPLKIIENVDYAWWARNCTRQGDQIELVPRMG